MNDFLLWLGIDAWRPVLTALLLPPAPFLLMAIVGARLLYRQRLLGWLLILVGVAVSWFSATDVAGQALRHWLLPPVRALSPSELAELKRAPKTAIVVLGGGRIELAPEYGVSDLTMFSLNRLRYGLWLSRETGLPVLYSGGIGHGAPTGASTGATEAEIAARVAERDFGRPLKWQEAQSRDTRENANRSVEMLSAQGIERIVLVTHAYHIPRARDNFARAITERKLTIELVPAPMGVAASMPLRTIDFLPTRHGFSETRLVLHEWLGRLLGA